MLTIAQLVISKASHQTAAAPVMVQSGPVAPVLLPKTVIESGLPGGPIATGSTVALLQLSAPVLLNTPARTGDSLITARPNMQKQNRNPADCSSN
jgi:hypothetical protein